MLIRVLKDEGKEPWESNVKARTEGNGIIGRGEGKGLAIYGPEWAGSGETNRTGVSFGAD